MFMQAQRGFVMDSAQPREYDGNQSDHQEEDSQSQEGQASSKLISE